MKKILVITTCSESSNGAGTIFLKSILSNHDYDWMNVNDLVSKNKFLLSKLFFKKISFFENNAESIFKWYQSLDLSCYNRIIITMSNLDLILFSSKILDFEKIRIMIWDDYRYIADNSKLRKDNYLYLEEKFTTLIKKIQCVSVMGSNMAKEYNLDLSKHTILRCPVDMNLMVERNIALGDPLNLVFCGSLYAKNEWNCLIKVLKKNNFIINGVRVNVHYIGNYPKTKVTSKKDIIYHGFKTGIELEKLVALMHVGYLPYWMDGKHNIVARTSFPSKLSFYLEHGLMIFNHSPKESEVSNINDVYKIGVSCNSLNEHEVYSCLKEMVGNFTHTNNIFTNLKTCVNSELSESVMFKNLDTLLK